MSANASLAGAPLGGIRKMRFWRGRSRAALASTLRVGGVGLVAFVASGVPATAATDEVRTDDPRDVGTRIDLKSLTHRVDGSVIVYTAETHAPFTDQVAVFKWGIDRDGDEDFDLIVFSQWREGRLTGGVNDAAGSQVAVATASRPGPTVVSVSFPVEVLGGASEYRYAASVGVDMDRDGNTDPGEGDLVPDAGLIQHRLGAVAPAAAGEADSAGTPPARAEAAAPTRSAAATPSPAPVKDPAGETAASRPAPERAGADLPRTGPPNRFLLSLAGAAFMAGGVLIGMRGAR